MIVVGIDPGMTGALARFRDGTLTDVVDMPVNDGRACGATLAAVIDTWDPDVAYVEDTHPMPKNGCIASFKLGLNTGVVIGVVQAARVSLQRVRPGVWKLRNGLRGKTKNASRGLASELWPAFADYFVRVRDDGRAEAALIGRYGMYDVIQRGAADGIGASIAHHPANNGHPT